jgi:radical SAM protein with 4Fe4S-binding SPASM domain
MQENTEEYNANKTYHEIVYSTKWEENKSDKYWQYRKEWVEYPKNKKVPEFPLHIDIETTNVCNLKCPMCPRTILLAKHEFSSQGYMSQEEYKSIIDQAVENGAYSIKLNYLGEPLLHKEVVWQVEYAKKAGIIDVMMNSNGDLLTKELGEELLKAGLDKLFISFDSISPDIYEVQRKGTTLGKVVDNLYQFLKLRNESYPDTHVRVSMVMYKTDEWIAQFEGLKAMWKNLVDAVGYGFYVERDYDQVETYPKVDGFYCEQLFQRMFLKYNGNATVCCVDDQDEYVVGNWKSEKLKDIWNSPAYKNIRKKHLSGDYMDINMCSKCYLPVSE